jgi:ADP-heptose:LPS heptosyltransferase
MKGFCNMKCNEHVKILVELMHGMGDTVCALPMLSLLRTNFPHGEISVLTKFPSAKVIIEASRIPVNQIQCLDIYKNLSHSISMLCELRRNNFDYGISSCITPVKKAKLFMQIVHPKKRVGLQNDNLYFDLLKDKYHFVQANLLSVREICNIPKEKICPTIYPDEQCVNIMREKVGANNSNRDIVGVCIGDADYSFKNRFLRTGKVHTRSWGIRNMASLIDLLNRKNLAIVLIGGKAEIPLSEYLKRHVSISSNIIDFVGRTSLKESIALASLCQCVVGVDTGMQHIADAVGTKTVSIFGPTNPHTHGAYSSRAVFLNNENCCPQQFCYGTSFYTDCPYQRKCLSSISPDQVFEAVMNSISG